MAIQAILFDFDNVLCDLCDIHFETLNYAIETVAGKEFCISEEEHLNTYNGRPTTTKLKLLQEKKNLPAIHTDEIKRLKQELTIQYIETKIDMDSKLVEIFQWLRHNGYKTACVSNSVFQTLNIGLARLGIKGYCDVIISNEDGVLNKPNPAQYLLAMAKLGVSPRNTFIVEDSPVGIKAAEDSCAYVWYVKNPDDVQLDSIKQLLEYYK